MKTIQQLVIMVALVIGAIGCDFRPFEPTGRLSPEPQAVPTLPPTPKTTPPTLKVTPSEVKRGEEIAVTGSGYTPDGHVLVILKFQDGGTMFAIEGTADEGGYFMGYPNIRIPSATPLGELKVVAIDETTEESVEQSLTVLPILPPEKAIEFAQMSVNPGGEVEFKANGYTPKENLILEIMRPDGTKIEHKAYADEYGRLEGTINVEEERPLGSYKVTITGQRSGHEATGWFTVTAPLRTITGKIVKKDDEKKKIRLVADDGRTETLKVTGNSVDENGDPIIFCDLNEGDRVKVEYNPRTEEATKIEKLDG